MQRASYQSALQHSIDRGVTESHPCKTIRLALKASDGPRRVASVLCVRCSCAAPGNPGLSVAAD
jgi:hypothetical protein